MPDYPGFIGPSNRAQSPIADCERLVNWYMEPSDAGTGKPALYPTPGQQAFVTVTTDVGTRALFTMNGRSLGIVGTALGEIFVGQTFARYGIVAQDANPAQITMNGVGGNQALASSGGNAYSLDLATNIMTGPFIAGEATQIGMIDGYGIAFNRTIGKIRMSNLNDFATWDPTQFALRSSAPDNWKAMLVNAPDIWLIGEQSGDVWYDAGTFPFPIAPRPGATFKYGIAATFSIAAAGDSVLWLSQNSEGAGILVRARGYVPQPVGSFAFNTAVAGYARTSSITDAEALTFQVGGHVFYVLKFPSANATWVYDLTTGLMFEMGKWNSAMNRFDVWGPRAITYAFGKHLVGDSTTGIIASLDGTVGTEIDGTEIVRVRIPPALSAKDGERLFMDRFELGVEPGLGTATGQGQDPVVMLRWSKNSGKTWGNQLNRSAGKMGEYGTRTFWTNGPSSLKTLVPEITVSDPIPYRLTLASYLGRGITPPQATRRE